MWWMVAILAAGLGADPSWVSVAQGTARAELHALPTAPLPAHPNARCRGQILIADGALEVTRVRGQVRGSQPCGAGLLQALQAQATGWDVVVRSYRPRPAYTLPVDFVTDAAGNLRLEMLPRDYGIGTPHPASVRLIEPGQQRPSRGRPPRLAAEARAALASGAASTCAVGLRVSAAGKVVAAQAHQECDSRLRKHAQRMAARMRFTPHRVNGDAVARDLTVSVRIQP